jgi:membrane protein DedA with SNARE-associated domain
MRFVGSASMDWLTGCVERHGIWIVGASRAVPLASEITALGAGASGMRRGPFLAAAIVGAAAASIPMALLGAGTFGGGGAAVVGMSAVAAGVALWIGARLWAAARPPADRRDIDLAGA